MRLEIERAQDIEWDFTVETKSFEANSGDFLALLVEGVDLWRHPVRSLGRRE